MPLRKDGTCWATSAHIGQEVQPFSEKQIALLQNFAAQAVIAMENARLIDRDSARRWSSRRRPREVLQVINSSPGNLGPVFDAMLEKANAAVRAPRSACSTSATATLPLAARDSGVRRVRKTGCEPNDSHRLDTHSSAR